MLTTCGSGVAGNNMNIGRRGTALLRRCRAARRETAGAGDTTTDNVTAGWRWKHAAYSGGAMGNVVMVW